MWYSFHLGCHFIERSCRRFGFFTSTSAGCAEMRRMTGRRKRLVRSPAVSCPTVTPRGVMTIFSFLLHSADRKDLDTLRRAQHYFCDLWYETCRLRFLEESLSPDRVTDTEIRKAMHYITKHYGERLQVGAIAAACNMTHAHFTNRFIHAAGMTPIAYIRQIRLGNACLMISQTEMSIGQIAERCGYENPFYFSRCFSAVYGMPPSVWREKNRA